MKSSFVVVMWLLAIACQSLSVFADESIVYLNSDSVLPKNHQLPFSEAVRVGNMVYLSGQIGIQPGTTKLVKGGIDAESKQTMDNIQASLKAHGLTMKDIVKCTIMMADIKEWRRFNQVYVHYFTRPYPARSAFATNGLALGARVEVECMAVVED